MPPGNRVPTHPGEVLLGEFLRYLGLTQVAFARHVGVPIQRINEIIKGKAALTPETALQLDRVLGIPAEFWNRRERHYRDHVARVQSRKRLSGQKDWVDRLPVEEMVRRGWVEACSCLEDQVEALLRFFGVADVPGWERQYAVPRAAFERSGRGEPDRGALAAWLRQGEREASAIHTEHYRKPAFRSALEAVRERLRLAEGLTASEVQSLCAPAGVAVVFVPRLDGLDVNGAVRWLSSTRALIQLSCVDPSEPRFLRTFFHEAAHVLLHGKRNTFLHLEAGAGVLDEEKEREADEWVESFLRPRGC